MSDNPDRNMKNGRFCSQLSTYFKIHAGFRSKTALRAAAETESTQGVSETGFNWVKETLDCSS
jgi:hypothetical protein